MDRRWRRHHTVAPFSPCEDDFLMTGLGSCKVAEAAECGRFAAGSESPTSGCGAPLHQALPVGSGTPLDACKGWPKSWQYVERHVLRAKGWPKSWQYVEPKTCTGIHISAIYTTCTGIHISVSKCEENLMTPRWRESDSTPQFTNRRIGGVRAASIHSFKPQHLVRIGGLVSLRTD